MIPIGKPAIGREDIEAVVAALKSGVLAQGKRVEEFEEAFAQFIGVKYAVATSSGTASLHLALLSHGIGAGDEVITTPFTFIATASSILLAGAKPVFADIEDDYFNVDPANVKRKITKRTKAIIPVHLYGHPADVKAIMELAHEHGLAVIEDACQAHGATLNNQKVGSFGTGCFSFYPTKNMTTGEGGMITTNSEDVAQRARLVRNHGFSQRYSSEILGSNMRMNELSAALGLVQLHKLPAHNQKRRDNAAYLSRKLRGIQGIQLPKVRQGCQHVFHQYTIRVTEESATSRNELARILKEKGIESGIYYPIPIHKQPLYRKLGYDDDLPISEKMSQQVISLPIHPGVTRQELDFISEVVKEVLQ
jgi:dTDP-4-amino-4,6-dideoxygalactose transaminase